MGGIRIWIGLLGHKIRRAGLCATWWKGEMVWDMTRYELC